MPGVDPVEAGWLKVVEVGRRRRRSRHRPADRPGPRRRRSKAGRSSACARCSRATTISTRCSRPARVPHPSAQLCARPCGRRGSGGRAHLRGDAGAVDRRHRRAQAGRRRRQARLRADHVVLAGNVHLGKLMPRVAGTLMPVWTYVMTTKPLGGAARRGDHLPRRGERHRSRRQPLPHRRRRPADVVGQGDHLGARSAPLRARAARPTSRSVYPQLGAVEFEHIWTGVLGNSLHRMPQIGELSPRIWLASGFGGHGLNTTAMAGDIIARAIAEGDDTWRRFVPFELVWSGGAHRPRGRAGALLVVSPPTSAARRARRASARREISAQPRREAAPVMASVASGRARHHKSRAGVADDRCAAHRALRSRPRQRPSRRAMNASRSNRCTSCSFLSSAPCSGGISFFGIALAQRLRADVLDHQELEPVEQFRGRRLLLQARHVADFVEQLAAPRRPAAA